MWISVDDRLPKDGEEVLTVFEYKANKDGIKHKKIFILHISIPSKEDTWIQSWGNDEIGLDPWHGKVSYWMPLPQLPK